MNSPVRPATTGGGDCVWIMVCPDDKQDPYLMSVPASTAVNAAKQHLISIAPDCNSPDYVWGVDMDFTFEMQCGGDAGERQNALLLICILYKNNVRTIEKLQCNKLKQSDLFNVIFAFFRTNSVYAALSRVFSFFATASATAALFSIFS
jgi:hypothetical protein